MSLARWSLQTKLSERPLVLALLPHYRPPQAPEPLLLDLCLAPDELTIYRLLSMENLTCPHQKPQIHALLSQVRDKLQAKEVPYFAARTLLYSEHKLRICAEIFLGFCIKV